MDKISDEELKRVDKLVYEKSLTPPAKTIAKAGHKIDDFVIQYFEMRDREKGIKFIKVNEPQANHLGAMLPLATWDIPLTSAAIDRELGNETVIDRALPKEIPNCS